MTLDDLEYMMGKDWQYWQSDGGSAYGQLVGYVASVNAVVAEELEKKRPLEVLMVRLGAIAAWVRRELERIAREMGALSFTLELGGFPPAITIGITWEVPTA